MRKPWPCLPSAKLIYPRAPTTKHLNLHLSRSSESLTPPPLFNYHNEPHNHTPTVTTTPTTTTTTNHDPLTQSSPPPHSPPNLRYIDIGINLTDPVYTGTYHNKQSHPPDLPQVLSRALSAGCRKLIVTGSDLAQSTKAVQLARTHPGVCYATVGVHPCSTPDFLSHPNPKPNTSTGPNPNPSPSFDDDNSNSGGATALLQALETLALTAKSTGHAVAFGEIGLDYDRLFLAPKPLQLKYFEAQLEIAVRVQLPLFLHSRAAGPDFERLLRRRLPDLLPLKKKGKGVVHSFTGTEAEMRALVEMGMDIGINGCSLKTAENLAVVAATPLERIQLETDGPWCEMRPSQASARWRAGAPGLPRAVKKERWEEGCMVKGRNEPCCISHVAWVVAGVKGVAVEEVCEAAWGNSVRMFGVGDGAGDDDDGGGGGGGGGEGLMMPA